jgi:hypothetical protein
MSYAAIICDEQTKKMLQIVVPDNARELNNPWYNKPGTKQFIIPKKIFDGRAPKDFFAVTLEYLRNLNPSPGITA